MNWKQCYDGSKIFFHDNGTVEFEDLSPALIAHHLASTNRWAGAARSPYTVAQHSLNVMLIARVLFDRDGVNPPLQMARVIVQALLHDAHEGFLGGDTPTPVKRWLRTMRGEDAFDPEAAIDDAIRAAFGLPNPPPNVVDIVKHADELALTSEAHALLIGGPRDQWTDAFKHDPQIIVGEPMSWDLARHMYCDALETALEMHAAFSAQSGLIKATAPPLLLPAGAR